jgi:cyclic beta-1,2-glucan synthetase
MIGSAEVRSLLACYRTADLDVTLRTVVEHWDAVLGAVQVTTPDRSMNVLLHPIRPSRPLGRR